MPSDQSLQTSAPPGLSLDKLVQGTVADRFPANRVLSLSGPNGGFFVHDGRLDIFAQEIAPDGRPGLRHYLCTIAAPGFVGVFPGDDAAKVTISAVSRNATLSSIGGSDLCGLAAKDAADLSVLLSGWIESLAGGLSRFFIPRSAPACILSPGLEQIAAPDSLVVTAKGAVWARIQDGEGRLMGLEEGLVKAGSAMIPITMDTWLLPGTHMAVAGQSMEAACTAGEIFDHLSHYHRVYAACLACALEKRQNIEASRLRKRSEKGAQSLGDALGRFVRLVSSFDAHCAAKSPDDALAQACAIAAKPLGITVADTPRLARRRGGDRPLTVEMIARIARFRTRQVALRGDWWRQDLGPMVAFAEEDGRPLALVPHKDRFYSVHDPMSGAPPCRVTQALASNIAPLAWVLYAPLPDGRITPFGLLKLGLRNQRRDLLVALLSGLLASLVANILPIATAATFAHIIPGHHSGQLIQVGLALIMTAAAHVIFKITGDVALLRIEGRMAGKLQAGILDRLLRLPSSFFNRYSTGDLASRTLTIETLRKALTGLVLSSCLAALFSLVSLGLLFYYQPWAALTACFLMLLMLSVATFCGMRQLANLMEGEALSGSIQSQVLQMISGVAKLRVAGAENRAWINWSRNFTELRARSQRSRRVSTLFSVYLAIQDGLSMALIFAVIAGTSGGTMETGAFLAFVSAFSMFMAAMTQLSRTIIQCFAVTPMVNLSRVLLDAVPEVDGNKAFPSQLMGHIEVNGVCFRYDRESPRVLNGLSLQVKPGQFIALVGPSGCGKSTLIKMLLGFEQPEAGGVFYDGVDLRTLDVQAVRRQIGVVLQAGRLMPGTIYENIKGASDASVDDAWDAARMAGLEADIRAMPMGMHTVLTEGTAALSGGQIQRLLIARAVVSKPRILLFDEATSALDNKTQAVVTDSLGRLSVTRIVIAHRLSTVQHADTIFVMDAGRVVESGTYAELMDRNGLFADLAHRQLT